MAKNWGWRPRCWGFVVPDRLSFCIGELPWSRRLGIQIGIWVNPKAKRGEFPYRWRWCWYAPTVRLLRRTTEPSVLEVIVSTVCKIPLYHAAAWTGRRYEITGIQIAGRLWVWAEPLWQLREPIPDHVSVFTPSKVRFKAWHELKVALDGVQQDMVTAYCISEGWIEQHWRDDSGEIVREPDRQSFSIRRVAGKVTVRYRP